MRHASESAHPQWRYDVNTPSKRLLLSEKPSLEMTDVRIMLDSAFRELRDTIRRTGTLLDDPPLYRERGRHKEKPRRKQN